jgi:hypothetical protein
MRFVDIDIKRAYYRILMGDMLVFAIWLVK